MRILVTLLTTCVCAMPLIAQSQQSPVGGDEPLPIVEVMGCLTSGPGNTWLVSRATDPVPSKTLNLDAEALKVVGAKSLGVLQFKLIGTTEIKPAELKGHKVAVKGLLIKDAQEARINVTALQSVSPTCAG